MTSSKSSAGLPNEISGETRKYPKIFLTRDQDTRRPIPEDNNIKLIILQLILCA
jgi:hypothetical protein